MTTKTLRTIPLWTFLAVTAIFSLLFSQNVSAQTPDGTSAWIQVEGGPVQSGITSSDVVGQGVRVGEECTFPKFTVGMKGDVSRVTVTKTQTHTNW